MGTANEFAKLAKAAGQMIDVIFEHMENEGSCDVFGIERANRLGNLERAVELLQGARSILAKEAGYLLTEADDIEHEQSHQPSLFGNFGNAVVPAVMRRPGPGHE